MHKRRTQINWRKCQTGRGIAPKGNRYRMLKTHFERKYHQAHQYDVLIRNLIPRYERMHSVTLNALRFPKTAKIKVLDLGIGTGETARGLFARFPGCKIVGIDISRKMVGLARQRLAQFLRQTKFVLGDFAITELGRGYNAAVSVLAVHHLPDPEKRRLFERIAASLKPGAPFVMADIIKFRSESMSKQMETKWKNYLLRSLGGKKANTGLRTTKKKTYPLRLKIYWSG